MRVVTVPDIPDLVRVVQVDDCTALVLREGAIAAPVLAALTATVVDSTR